MNIYTDLKNRLLTTLYTVLDTQGLGIFVITKHGIIALYFHKIYFRG